MFFFQILWLVEHVFTHFDQKFTVCVNLWAPLLQYLYLEVYSCKFWSCPRREAWLFYCLGYGNSYFLWLFSCKQRRWKGRFYGSKAFDRRPCAGKDIFLYEWYCGFSFLIQVSYCTSLSFYTVCTQNFPKNI